MKFHRMFSSRLSTALMFLILIIYGFPAFGEEFNAVILMYHKFGEDAFPSTSVTLKQFDTQLDYLKKNGFHVLPLEEIVAAFRTGKPLPDKSIALTVDDAYASVYEHAYPRLKKLNWPFTVFVATDPVDKGLGAYMTWDRMREMKQHGASYANHTATHDYLVRKLPGESDDAYITRIRSDIERAQQRLSEELGIDPDIFAYPYGEYNTAVAKLVGAMGFTAFGQHSGVMGPHNDPLCLPRFAVNQHYGDIEGLRDKLNALSFPVASVEPFEPVTAERRPVLEIRLRKTDARLDQLNCFTNGQGTVPKWIEKDKHFSIQAEKPLPEGRNRYTCTVPGRERTRYHWFSHQWVIVPKSDSSD